ncbi:hypothetical protein GOBAR_AA10243 [Gossypium barbadense]|uniref:Kinesin motor domain-containing protein n=1 Tax=Gossypium barbadense TaxID=3634 RepID=A0A2P5Y4D3_GOSBA|nr:hypothetical protein GOBAR_AA10243 [Gossypium barbadense]
MCSLSKNISVIWIRDSEGVTLGSKTVVNIGIPTPFAAEVLACLQPIQTRLELGFRQGTFVEGVKEEVVLSPTHALSLIAAGEESSSCGENSEGEAVNLSQLNLIDLAGSESSKLKQLALDEKRDLITIKAC